MYPDIFHKPLLNYSHLCQKIDGEVTQQSNLVLETFELAEILNISENTQHDDEVVNSALNVQNYKNSRRASPYYNHLNAVSEGISVVFGINKKISHNDVKAIIECVKYYTNRILKQWKGIDLIHMLWVNAWLEVLTTVENYCKDELTASLGGDSILTNNSKEKLFQEINQGESIISNLKPTTGEAVTSKMLLLPSRLLKNQLPSMRCEGKHWFIENQKNAHNLAIKNVEMNSVIYLHNCEDTTLRIDGKINSITMNSCKKTSVMFDSIISTFEFINCQSVQMQVYGRVPTIIIHKTDGCLIYLSDESLDVEIISSNSTQMNLLASDTEGEFTDYAIPEQLKSVLIPGKGLRTSIVHFGA